LVYHVDFISRGSPVYGAMGVSCKRQASSCKRQATSLPQLDGKLQATERKK